jgi:hypothetical protein
VDFADLENRAIHDFRKESGSKDRGGAWIPCVEFRVRRWRAACMTAAAKWHTTEGGAWNFWGSPIVLPKMMRRAKVLMKAGLSMVFMLVTPSGEAVARMKAWWAFRIGAAYGQSKSICWVVSGLCSPSRTKQRAQAPFVTPFFAHLGPMGSASCWTRYV